MSRIPRWTRRPGQSQQFLDNLEEETGILRRSSRKKKAAQQLSPENRGEGRQRREVAPVPPTLGCPRREQGGGGPPLGDRTSEQGGGGGDPAGGGEEELRDWSEEVEREAGAIVGRLAVDEAGALQMLPPVKLHRLHISLIVSSKGAIWGDDSEDLRFIVLHGELR